MTLFHTQIDWKQEYESFVSEKQKRKRRGNLRKCSGFPYTCRGRDRQCAPAPPVQTLVSSKPEPQETTGKAYNIS